MCQPGQAQHSTVRNQLAAAPPARQARKHAPCKHRRREEKKGATCQVQLREDAGAAGHHAIHAHQLVEVEVPAGQKQGKGV